MKQGSRHWRWYLSALFYKRTYDDLAHQLDDDLFAYLGDLTQGAVVADCGCGPGIVTEKFLKRGAARVFAIDVNEDMLGQVKTRLADDEAAGRVEIVQCKTHAALFPDLQKKYLDNKGFDIIFFKRSLYVKKKAALKILQAAVESLNPGGVLAVIHGERTLRRYAFGPGLRPTSYTLYNLFNRSISRLGEWLGGGDYTLYTKSELLNLMQKAAPDRKVEYIPSRQIAYNLVAVTA
jgi:SAM-dependent methyltransferase